MARYALILILAVGGLFVAFLILRAAFSVLHAVLEVFVELIRGIVRAMVYPFHAVPRWLGRRKALRAQKMQRAEIMRIEHYRGLNPVQIAGTPNLSAIRSLLKALDDSTSASAAYRPVFDSDIVDTRFRHVKYTPIPVARNCEREADAPVAWEMTPDDLTIAPGASITRLYSEITSPIEFPVPAPVPTFNPPTLPKRPVVELPTWEMRLVRVDDGSPINLSGEHQRAYAPELERLSSIQTHLETLETEIRRKAKEASEAADLADIHLAYEALKFGDFKDSILQEYAACKQRYESERDLALSRAKIVHEEYVRRTKTGIENHFHLTLGMISLPLPPDYPWVVFYEPTERTLQVNQRLPLLSDIIVKRSDSKRPIAKRDAEHFLRRILPAIVMSTAQQVASNDLNEDVATIVVNGWSRYFEKATGKLRDAYVATLKVSPAKIRDIDINKADPLAAFRGLGGIFVYSPDEVTPIDPEIRLDKEDRRFVEGREVLSGLTQGQNLGEMDWQDFEHLIRELLSKEYARDGAEVRITRASRDQGVDAVIFNPDPLRGGKYVVQAKRYNSVVELSAVRDLWGTVNSEGASRGILVTTSWFGRDAYEWISNKSITLIDGQNLLALLTKHGYRFTIND